MQGRKGLYQSMSHTVDLLINEYDFSSELDVENRDSVLSNKNNPTNPPILQNIIKANQPWVLQ